MFPSCLWRKHKVVSSTQYSSGNSFSSKITANTLEYVSIIHHLFGSSVGRIAFSCYLNYLLSSYAKVFGTRMVLIAGICKGLLLHRCFMFVLI